MVIAVSTQVRGRVVFITGGASGIGKATAQQFAQTGARVVVSDVDPAVEQLADELRTRGAEALGLIHDVTDETAWTATLAATLERFGRLDVLVNNAGIALARPLVEMELAAWRRVMAVNLDGVFLGTKHAVEVMKRQGQGGVIVNMSSASGLVGSPMSSAYCASKGGVRLFTKAVAPECAADGIRVNSVHPGAVRTPIWERADWWPGFAAQAGGTDAAWQALAAATPLGRLAEPEEDAGSDVYLASDDARFMTGGEFVLDGGYTAQ
jgi:NAD(P)-dependent dehydrogenase (short-subunit alcohol dehydrogenase family)